MTPTGAARSDALRIQLLGGFGVWIGSRQIPQSAWRLRKAAALVKLLALAPDHRLHREQIADVLWPDAEPKGALNSLHQVVHFARRTLEPGRRRLRDSSYLCAEGDLLRLDAPAGVWVDVAEFERLTSTSDQQAQRQALQLYVGDLLPEDRYEEWAVAPREALRLRFASASLAVAQSAADQGETAFAERVLLRLLERDRTLEAAHVALIRLYAEKADLQRAGRQFADLAAALREELGVEPGEEATRLKEQLRLPVPPSARPKAAAATRRPPTNLPSPLTSFVGRQVEIGEIAQRLRSHRIVTLAGIGGTGKTRLAIEVAWRELPGFAGGTWLADLAGLAPEGDVEAAVATAVRAPGTAPPRERILRHLQRRRALVLLDNCEHVADSCASLVVAILAACPEVSVLATSRRPLRVEGESVYRVPPLSLPGAPGVPAQTNPSDAVALFIERVELARHGSAWTPTDTATVSEICRRLDGLPLAIELAAPQARVLDLREILRRLADRSGFPAAEGSAVHRRQQTMREVLEWSYRVLSQPEQAGFRLLSIFVGGFVLEAASAVLKSGGHEEDALEVLSSLVDYSLVEPRDAPDGGVRYTMLETLREYAASQLTDEESRAARRAHASFYACLAGSADQGVRTERQAEWLARIDAEHDNLTAALAWLADCEPSGALAMTTDLAYPWMIRGRLREARSWLERLLGVSSAPRPLRTRALWTAAYLARSQGDYAAAACWGEESLRLARADGDALATARALNELAILARYRSEYQRSAEMLREAAELFAAAGDSAGVGHALNSLGNVYWYRGEYVPAREAYEKALSIHREVGNPRWIAASLSNLAGALPAEEAGRARSLYEEALALHRRAMHPGGIAHVLYNLGEMDLLAGDLVAAEARFSEAVAISGEIGDRRQAAHAGLGLAAAALAAGATDRPFGLLRDALQTLREVGDRDGVARAVLGFAVLAARTGDFPRAATLVGLYDTLNRDTGTVPPVFALRERDRVLSEAAERLGLRATEDARRIGASSSLDDLLPR